MHHFNACQSKCPELHCCYIAKEDSDANVTVFSPFNFQLKSCTMCMAVAFVQSAFSLGGVSSLQNSVVECILCNSIHLSVVNFKCIFSGEVEKM